MHKIYCAWCVVLGAGVDCAYMEMLFWIEHESPV